MTKPARLRLTLLAGITVIALVGVRVYTQAPGRAGGQGRGAGAGQGRAAGPAAPVPNGDILDPARNPLPNPNVAVIRGFGVLPDGRKWGNSAGVSIGPDQNVWAYDRCGENTCENSNLTPIFKFDRNSGKVLASFGAGMFVFPHGLYVDRDGNVWVTDGQANKAGTKGQQVFKFSPDGKVLLTLGKAGVSGNGRDTFNQPSSVVVAPNGDIFVGDGHGGNSNARIVKFSKDGRYIKDWGKMGSAPGEFSIPHAMAFDSKGRLFVADRPNHRIQIFDQDGKFLDQWKQFGRVSGLAITRNDTLYAIDSESNETRHPGWMTGIRLGTANEDKVTAFIPPHPNGKFEGGAGEGIAVDRDGNVYAAEGPISRPFSGGGLTKYIKP